SKPSQHPRQLRVHQDFFAAKTLNSTPLASRERYCWPITHRVAAMLITVSREIPCWLMANRYHLRAVKVSEADLVRAFAFRFFFLNCLEIFDAVVSPKEFSDRR
ncbi:hypothetical protein, partial [Pseudomonas serbica]|uniref:hypothetical protein n=1 Tax=Pseudomonas serbica TaxID=2965074 RepID=UPI0039E351E4